MSDYGRERVVLIEIDQPLCARVYGDGAGSPTPATGCLAVLSADEPIKCFNSRFTCQDPDRYDPGTLTLRFGASQQELTRYYGYVIPSLLGHDTTPGALNLAGMYDTASPLGQREVVTLTFEDHRHSDLLVDKYRLERLSGAASFGSPPDTYDPYTRGTFWGKWLARNPYYVGYPLRVYEGFLGDDIEDMRVRHYIIDRVEGPADGQVRVIAKDTFTKLESKKAVAPAASRGELGANITDSSGSATLSPSGIGDDDYPHRVGSPSELYIAIGNEVIRGTRSNEALTLTQRGAFGTTPDSHNDEDLVQLVLVYSAQRAIDIAYDLLVNYAGIDAASIDFDEWEVQAAELTQLYSAAIAEPTPVSALLGELCQQAGFTLWHDAATGMINLRALRASSSIATIDDAGWIIEGSLTTKPQDEKRLSLVWVYYGLKSPLEALDDRRNYYSRVVVIDPDAELPEQYGTPKIQEVFSRFIPQFGRESAVETGERILSLFRNPPIEARFAVDAGRDEDLALARFITVETSDIQDATGAVEDANQYAVVSLERSNAQVNVVAQQINFADIPGDEGTEDDPRTIFIENDVSNVNLRTIHDTLYTAPTDSSPPLAVTFVVLDGVTVGATSVSNYAIRTGSWPSTVVLALQNDGRIYGAGGAGGDSGNFDNGRPGNAGGPALLAERALTVTNNGEIWGGGGGGGGGGCNSTSGCGGREAGSGGGGAGSTPGAGGATEAFPPCYPDDCRGQTGTTEAGGAGGQDGLNINGDGGPGGGPGLAGGDGGVHPFGGPGGGPGGAAGSYVVGNAFVTWLAVGDVRGGVA